MGTKVDQNMHRRPEIASLQLMQAGFYGRISGQQYRNDVLVRRGVSQLQSSQTSMVLRHFQWWVWWDLPQRVPCGRLLFRFAVVTFRLLRKSWSQVMGQREKRIITVVSAILQVFQRYYQYRRAISGRRNPSLKENEHRQDKSVIRRHLTWSEGIYVLSCHLSSRRLFTSC